MSPAKPPIDVILVVTVKERRAGIIRHEVDLRDGISGQANCVFDDAECRLGTDFRDLERVPMHVHRMLVSTAVVHDEPVVFAFRRREQRVRKAKPSQAKPS
nr:hypothetical protein [Bradyrhizobium canariense]